MLCSVAEVEEAKQMLQIIPICVAVLIPATIEAQVNTLFVKQGTTLDRHIGPHFQIPPASLSTFMTISMLVSLVVYDRLFMKCMRVWTKNPRGITPLQRIGTGLVLHIIAILVASLVEKKRLSIARDHGVALSGGEVPLTIFILLPQYVLLGVSECFYGVGKMEFFYIEAPQTMKSLGTSCALATYGVGNFLSSVLLSTVSKITKRNGHEGWILDNLDASHLDYYYVFLAVLGFLNFAFFLVLSKLYVYKAEAFESKEVSAEEHHAANAHEETGT